MKTREKDEWVPCQAEYDIAIKQLESLKDLRDKLLTQFSDALYDSKASIPDANIGWAIDCFDDVVCDLLSSEIDEAQSEVNRFSEAFGE